MPVAQVSPALLRLNTLNEKFFSYFICSSLLFSRLLCSSLLFSRLLSSYLLFSSSSLLFSPLLSSPRLFSPLLPFVFPSSLLFPCLFFSSLLFRCFSSLPFPPVPFLASSPHLAAKPAEKLSGQRHHEAQFDLWHSELFAVITFRRDRHKH